MRKILSGLVVTFLLCLSFLPVYADSQPIVSGTLTGISDDLLDKATNNMTYDGPIDELLLWVLYNFRDGFDYVDAYFGVDESVGDMTAIIALDSLGKTKPLDWTDRIMRKFSSSISVYSSKYSTPTYSSVGSFFDDFDAHIFLIDTHYHLLSLVTWDSVRRKAYESEISEETWNELVLTTWGVELAKTAPAESRPSFTYVKKK